MELLDWLVRTGEALVAMPTGKLPFGPFKHQMMYMEHLALVIVHMMRVEKVFLTADPIIQMQEFLPRITNIFEKTLALSDGQTDPDVHRAIRTLAVVSQLGYKVRVLTSQAIPECADHDCRSNIFLDKSFWKEKTHFIHPFFQTEWADTTCVRNETEEADDLGAFHEEERMDLTELIPELDGTK